jgi:hypothetical protein
LAPGPGRTRPRQSARLAAQIGQEYYSQTTSGRSIAVDGLNLDALRMSALGDLAQGPFWGPACSRPSMHWQVLTGERSKTQSVLFHRPRDESPIASGRTFYRIWLNLTRFEGRLG